MKTLSRFLLILCAALVTLALAACGNTFSAKQSAQGQPVQNATTPSSTTAQTGQTPATSATPPPSQGQIVLSFGKAQYTTNERIQITITNHLATPIFVSAYYTSCTYISLARQTQSGWLSLGRCLTAATHSVALQPGASVVQQLTPPVSNPQMAAHALWPTGTYRATLFYALSPDGDTTQGKSVTSSTFLVG